MATELKVTGRGTAVSISSDGPLSVEGPHIDITNEPTGLVGYDDWRRNDLPIAFRKSAGAWHAMETSSDANLTAQSMVNADGAEQDLFLTEQPLRDTLRHAIDNDYPQILIFRDIDRLATEMKSNGVSWAYEYGNHVKHFHNRIKEEAEIEKGTAA